MTDSAPMSDNRPQFLHDKAADHEVKRPAPGHWSWFGGNAGALAVRLPCGHLADLTGHQVEPDGEVMPSVVCAYGDYHANIVLADWHGVKPFNQKGLL